MGELLMTAYRPRAEPQDEADPRVSLIVDPQSQTHPNSQQTQPSNGVTHQNGGPTVQKKKPGLKQTLPHGCFKNRKRCRLITAIILTVLIISAVAIILAVFLKSSDNDSTLNHVPETKNQSRFLKTTKMPETTTSTAATSTTSTTMPPETTVSVPVPEVNEFANYPDRGDSRLFKINLDNGDIIRTYGSKSSNGNLVSLTSISVAEGTGSDTHIRLGNRNNLASVMLSDGTHVSYDMSDNLQNLEMKIFTGGPIDLNPKTPRAFVQGILIDKNVSVLTRLLLLLSGKQVSPNRRPGVAQTVNTTCISYLPLRVTKCGSQYPYEGAFIEGKVRIGGKSPVLMAALPWPTERDECFQQTWESNTRPNYYIPLPSQLNRSASFAEISQNCDSHVDYFYPVCSSQDAYDQNLHMDMCNTLANQTARAQGGNSVIYSSVFSSCRKIFSSINSMCSALQYKSVDEPTWKTSKDVLSRSLCSLPESQGTVADDQLQVGLHVLAFCPSQTPFRSPEQNINMRFNQSKSIGSPIHINCEGSPEVTFVSVGHAYTGSSSLDRVMHRFRVCSICAFETSVRAVLTNDKICCDDTCLDNRVCREGRIPAIEESTFRQHSSVYCHDFFADRGYNTESLKYNCKGKCETNLSVNFTMFDVSSQKTFYHQAVTCHESELNACKMEFGR
ncbi:hypothetical protein SNE40_008279 [Patella caerulea]|uniref:Uncharacterized protein n=1 Tax=Patella caerulea TaxID=87958 RepID=A0AAN8PUX6_PATCE